MMGFCRVFFVGIGAGFMRQLLGGFTFCFQRVLLKGRFDVFSCADFMSP